MASESMHPSLLDRVRNVNDHAAWRELDDRYRELILRYGQRRGLQTADTEDARQVVMMQLAGRLLEFVYHPEVGRFRDYLGKVVQNAIHKHFSRQGRRPEVLVSDAGSLPDTEVTDDPHWREWMLHHYRQAMKRVRATFKPQSLEIFEGLLEGKPGDELARQHGITPEGVYKIKQRIRERLKEYIARQVHEEEFSERRSAAS